MQLTTRAAAVGVGALAALGAAPLQAQPIEFSAAADRDRWVYPFNATPGSRFVASTFGAALIDGFDDRDAQYVLGWDTAGAIPPGLRRESYLVSSVTVRARIADGDRFFYDPSADPTPTFYDESDPGFVADADPGRPLELWPVGYRDGFDLLSWEDTSPFSVSAPVIEPAQGHRVIFAADLDASGNAADVSNAIKERFDPTPPGIGIAPLTPGDPVPADTEFTFALDLCQEGVRGYIRDSLAQGRLNLAIASVHSVSFDPDNPDEGPGEISYPIFYTTDNPLAQVLGYQPGIAIEVEVIELPDFDGNGAVNVLDVVTFINAWNAADPSADIDGNCQFNVLDVLTFITIFNG